MTYRPRRLRPHRSVTIVSGIHDEAEMDIASAAIRTAKATGGPLFIPSHVTVATVPGSARWYIRKEDRAVLQWAVGTKAHTPEPESDPDAKRLRP